MFWCERGSGHSSGATKDCGLPDDGGRCDACVNSALTTQGLCARCTARHCVMCFSTDFGYLMLIAGVGHGVLHIVRFSIGGDADLLYKTDAGRSGVICMLLLFPVVLPMKFKWFKDRVSRVQYIRDWSWCGRAPLLSTAPVEPLNIRWHFI